jgi:transcriptional regulator with XRE-family HTH domain
MEQVCLRAAVAEVLRVERARARIKNPELCAKSGVSHSALGRLIAGERDMSMPQLFALTAVVGLTPAEFMAAVMEVVAKHRTAPPSKV